MGFLAGDSHPVVVPQVVGSPAAVSPVVVSGTGPVTALRALRRALDGAGLVVETSGSLAAPKRVLLSASALHSSATATHTALGGPGQWLLVLPPYYIAGLQVLVRGILAGINPVIGPTGPFTPKGFVESVATMRADRRYVSLVPTQLARLVAESDRPEVRGALRSFDTILVGGQATPPDLFQRAEELGYPVVCSYGATETAGGCVYDGIPLAGVQLRIDSGVIQISGPVLADGYLDDPQRTAEVFIVDNGIRWYRTGDLGHYDSGGRLVVTGRADDVIISGGVKVVLSEVEDAIRAIPGFAAAVAIPVPSQWGESVAVVVPRTEATSSPDAFSRLVTGCALLGPAARPVSLTIVDAIAQLPSGKTDRRALGRFLAQQGC